MQSKCSNITSRAPKIKEGPVARVFPLGQARDCLLLSEYPLLNSVMTLSEPVPYQLDTSRRSLLLWPCAWCAWPSRKARRVAFTILLVDDNKDFRAEFRDCLDEYNVVEAASGQEALDALRKPNEIDLVLLDVVMPGMRGTDVLRAIKKMQPDLAVVMLTGYGTKGTVIEALKGRADDFVEKSGDPEKTKEVIARLLRDRPGRREADIGGVGAKIKRVTYFLERNYDKNVSLKDAAALAYLSPKYLSRVFKQEAGIGFNQYKAKVKANRAARLLVETAYNVDEISARLGYANPESFARLFKSVIGMAPSAYRAGQRAGTRAGRRAGGERRRPGGGRPPASARRSPGRAGTRRHD